MKRVLKLTVHLVILISTINISCKSKLKQTNENKAIKIDTLKKQTSFHCFESIDTTQQQETKGCSGYYYKKIKNKFVLEIHYDSTIQFDSCIHLYIDTTNSNKWTQLFIYKDGDASLFVYCNDYGDGHYPISSSNKAFGDIYIRFYKSNNIEPTVSIWINRLTFIDTINKQQTTLSNELLWRVSDFGPSGG
jgi:hypothetical protein